MFACALVCSLLVLVLLVFIGCQVYWVFPHLTTPCYLFLSLTDTSSFFFLTPFRSTGVFDWNSASHRPPPGEWLVSYQPHFSCIPGPILLRGAFLCRLSRRKTNAVDHQIGLNRVFGGVDFIGRSACRVIGSLIDPNAMSATQFPVCVRSALCKRHSPLWEAGGQPNSVKSSGSRFRLHRPVGCAATRTHRPNSFKTGKTPQ